MCGGSGKAFCVKRMDAMNNCCWALACLGLELNSCGTNSGIPGLEVDIRFSDSDSF